MIGVLLVVIAVVLAIETKSLLLGEGADAEQVDAIERAITDGPEVERIIHMKTLHLGPEELLVAAKIAVPRATSAPTTWPGASTRPRRGSGRPCRSPG